MLGAEGQGFVVEGDSKRTPSGLDGSYSKGQSFRLFYNSDLVYFGFSILLIGFQ